MWGGARAEVGARRAGWGEGDCGTEASGKDMEGYEEVGEAERCSHL